MTEYIQNNAPMAGLPYDTEHLTSPNPLLSAPKDWNLIAYFRSGWVFLIPYLILYLVYAWWQWPINPTVGNQHSAVSSQVSLVPCLLHLYWLLHATHVVLAAIALRIWLRNFYCNIPSLQNQTAWQRLYAIVPWVCLALVFWIPGVYLEWPSDPWEHFARITRWRYHEFITAEPIWHRSSYFFAYSFIGRITPPLLQLKWFGIFYTACCLLLCWQYFRLARALNLSNRTSFVFVIIQALTFGNNIFGFYRYYGMSSSLFAQLAAVAFIRIGFEIVVGNNERNSEKNRTLSLSSLFQLFKAFFPRGASVVALVFVMAFNHLQGLSIAVLGLSALVVWRLIAWRRAMIGWLAVIAVILSIATIIWYPRHPALDEIYRPQGWLTAWYTFNLFSTAAPAFDRALVILGLSGIINIVAAFFLFRRNDPIAWLTLTPIIALCLPFFALPFANLLAPHYNNAEGIITFHRMLFAIPQCLAVVALCGSEFHTLSRQSWEKFKIPGLLPFGLLLLALTVFMVAPANGQIYNRIWHVMMVPADDLAMHDVIASFEKLPRQEVKGVSRLLTTAGIGLVYKTVGAQNVFYYDSRTINVTASPAARTVRLQHFISVGPNDQITGLFVVPPLNFLQNSSSQAAYLSRHWMTQEVALNFVGGSECVITALQVGGERAMLPPTRYLFGKITLDP